jgi:glycosyltransferase involved in cell wall biosynthesis
MTRCPGSAARRTAVVTLVGVDPGLPSFRLRLAPLAEYLQRDGLQVNVVALHGPEWQRVWRLARTWSSSTVLVFSKTKLLLGELGFVARRCPTWVLDVDDAVMFRKPRRHGDPPDAAGWRRHRFHRMVAHCRLVVAASQSLAAMIEGAPLTVVPTPVPLASYPRAPIAGDAPLKLAWIGVGANLRYLNDLAPVFRRLASEGLEFELRVISDRLPELPGLPCHLVAWSEQTEGRELAACDVGLAPLSDDAWTRGKGAYRCIQYAAAGLPAVAAPVGANREVVIPGETGVWASTRDEWHAALVRLAGDVALRRRLGAAARERARRYDRAVVVPRYAELLLELVESHAAVGAAGL